MKKISDAEETLLTRLVNFPLLLLDYFIKYCQQNVNPQRKLGWNVWDEGVFKITL